MFLLFSMLAPLAGCGLGQWYQNGFKVGPDYAAPPAAVAEHFIDADNPRVKNLQDANPQWWTSFNDPCLNYLVATASRENLNLKNAGMRILEARAQRGVADGNLFPQQQNLSGQYQREALSQKAYPFDFIPLPKYDYNNWSASANLAWELDFWGRFRRAVEAADANLQEQCANYNNVLVLLQAEVAQNYIQTRSYEERLTLARKNVELQKETLRIITLRAQRGLVTDLDVQQSTYNLGQTQALIPPLEAGRRTSQNRLCILMAMPPRDMTQFLRSPGTIPTPPPEIVVGIPAELLRRRPDVQQAERAAAQQSAQIGVAESDFYPHISITGAVGVESENLTQLFERQSLVGQIGPGFTWNILNFGRITNNVAAQNARFQQAILTYRDTVLRANEEVENDIIAYLTEQDRVALLAGNAKAAGKSADLASQQYEHGLINYQPLLDAERVLVQQQDALAESRGMVGLDLVNVYKALGGGWRANAPVAVASPANEAAVPSAVEVPPPAPVK